MKKSYSALTPAQQHLAAKYLPLARKLARPYKLRWRSVWNDFESAACLALVEAAGRYEPARRVKFSTYATHRIWGALRDVQRSMLPMGYRCDPDRAPEVGSMSFLGDGRQEKPQHADERYGQDAIKVRSFGTVIGADRDEDPCLAVDDQDAVEHWLRKLPARHAAACRQIYVHGKTQHEAAEALGYSQSRLSYIHREAMSILDGSWERTLLAESP